MKLNVLDRSNYFKGLLILAAKDKEINNKESAIIERLGQVLDFDSGFVQECMTDYFKNEYITEEPVKFSTMEIAESFVKDGIKIVLSNNVIESKEFQWLITIANVNGLTDSFYAPLIEEYKNSLPDNYADIKLEIEKHL